MTKIEDRYLGDGVYASYDGLAIVLDLRGQDDSTKIFLEGLVFAELTAFAEDIRKASGLDKVGLPF